MTGELLRRHSARLAAIGLIVLAYTLTRAPALSQAERATLADRYAFARSELPALPGDTTRTIRAVNPSLSRISGWISSVGAAVALNDLDGDGLSNDVCAVDTRNDQVGVAPVPGTPARYPAFALHPAPLPYDSGTMAPMGCLPGDLNEDGRMDLVVYYWGRTPVAFLRQANGAALAAAAFTAQELVPSGGRWFTNAATMADMDGDGHIDLVIGNYFPDDAHVLDTQATNHESMQDSMSRAFNGGAKHFLLWAGATSGDTPSVRFQQAASGLEDAILYGWTLALGAADLDADLLPELYIGNDFGPDRLLHNQSSPGQLRFTLLEGQKTFTSPGSKVLGHDSFKGMGVDFGDLNGDGLLDIYVSNITTEFGLQESNFAFLSTRAIQPGDRIAPYVDRSEQLGLARSGWAWDARLADFNNDGVLEALQATGFVKGAINRWPELHELAMGNDTVLHDPRSWLNMLPGDDLAGHQPNPFFVRADDGRYYDLSNELGLALPEVSRGIATADVDADGRLDFALANQWAPSAFYHNQSRAPGAFLGLRLLLPVGDASGATQVESGQPQAAPSGRPAIGASAHVRLADGRQLVAQVDGGNGHSGKRSPELLFGLGALDPAQPLQVEIRWRDTRGQPQQQQLTLTPGWHSVMLGT